MTYGGNKPGESGGTVLSYNIAENSTPEISWQRAKTIPMRQIKEEKAYFRVRGHGKRPMVYRGEEEAIRKSRKHD